MSRLPAISVLTCLSALAVACGDASKGTGSSSAASSTSSGSALSKGSVERPAMSGSAPTGSPSGSPSGGSGAEVTNGPVTAKIPPYAQSPSCSDGDFDGCNKKCDAGGLESCDKLARSLEIGSGPHGVDIDRAIEIDRKTCDQGFGRGCMALSNIYLYGRGGTPKDASKADALRKRAEPLLIPACDGGDAYSCSALMDVYDAAGPSKDSQKVELYRGKVDGLLGKACDGGDAGACKDLGYDLISARKFKDAVAPLEKGCKGGDASACAQLGDLYKDGNGVTKDVPKAKALLKQACDKGIDQGCIDGRNL